MRLLRPFFDPHTATPTFQILASDIFETKLLCALHIIQADSFKFIFINAWSTPALIWGNKGHAYDRGPI